MRGEACRFSSISSQSESNGYTSSSRYSKVRANVGGKLNNETKMYIRYFLIVTIAIPFIMEIAIRVISSYQNIYNIEMMKYAQTLKIPDPLKQNSHVHRPNASALLMGAVVETNSLGDRGPELSTNRSALHRRVFVVGSSMTMGWGVPYEKVFTTQVQQKLNEHFQGKAEFEFVNAGVGNYNTYNQYILYQRQIDQVKPNMVILHYYVSDARPNPNYSNNLFFKYSYLASYLYTRIREYSFNKVSLFDYYKDLYTSNNAQWMKTLEYIRSMKEIADKNKIPFLVVMQPELHNLQKGSPYIDLYTSIENDFLKSGITTLNPYSEFQSTFAGRESDVWIQYDDPHMNAEGHTVLANILFNYFVSKELLSAKTKLPIKKAS